ncbi:MAG: endonuclease MutS2 [Candidatus Omnitrophota bacterium]|jgi:DNA mismatch repair protein MutS2|nr:MAG: endonuclease MutS2 [Candidatus Omnitrophota bacterium]
MDEHAFQVLEFYKVKELILPFAVSALGREAIAALQPAFSASEIRFALQEVTEMVRLWELNREPPLNGLYDVRDPLRRCAVPGAVLDPAELIVIGETIAAARRIQTALRNIKEEAPHINQYGNRLIPHPDIEKIFETVFDEQKQIRDTASRELAQIRKSIHQQREFIVKQINRMIRTRFKDFLQEAYYTQRDDRYVLPIDARYQNKVKGIVHDRSATGTTVFIEPFELVEDSNRLKELRREEEMEIRRILQDLTAKIAENQFDFLNNIEIFRQLDFLAAKARFSIRYRMNEPVITEDGSLVIVNGRHPLLIARHERENVVPLNLALPPDVHGLVITGPNTGGKTVVLKTVGLLVLMAQSGLHIPADGASEIPVFRSFGADIGDEQSLEQSLSTFSSHMSNIRAILFAAGERSLVMLDELGSGTDPVEGGALATAIIEQLHTQKATFLVTTHLQELKLYTYNKAGMENGAMEFDSRTLEPTFLFTMGLPGQSNAIQIADRLGLPPAIIQRARSQITEQGGSPEHLLKQLGEELQTARNVRISVEEELRKAHHLKQENEQRLQKARNEARETVRRAERKAQGLIHELERRIQKMDRQEREFQKEWHKKLTQLVESSQKPAPPVTILAHLRHDLETVKRQVEKAQPPPIEESYERKEWSWDQLKTNSRVRIAGFSKPGKVRQVSKNRNEVEVHISLLNLRVKADQILEVLPAEKSPEEIHPPGITVERPESVANRCDVHGMTVDEMIPVVQKYLDHAYLAGVTPVTIVHGHGTGILRRAVRSLLHENPTVKSFQNGDSFEGGGGVTVVQLKFMRS